jgi:hypothetical protein
MRNCACCAVAAVAFAAGLDWAGAISSLSSLWFSICRTKRPVSGVAPHEERPASSPYSVTWHSSAHLCNAAMLQSVRSNEFIWRRIIHLAKKSPLLRQNCRSIRLNFLPIALSSATSLLTTLKTLVDFLTNNLHTKSRTSLRVELFLWIVLDQWLC